MAEKRHVQHIRSSVVENGKAKLPSSDALYYGEIAINYAKGYETISLKNNSGDVVTFSSDAKNDESYAFKEHTHEASAITDFNSAVDGVVATSTTITNRIESVVSSAITNNESVSASVETVISAFTDSMLDDRFAFKEHTHEASAITDFNSTVEGVVATSTTITDRVESVVSSAITNNESVSASVETVISAFTDSTLDDRYAFKEHTHEASAITDWNGAVESTIASSTTITNRIESVVSSAITNNESVSASVETVISAFTDSTLDDRYAFKEHTHEASAITDWNGAVESTIASSTTITNRIESVVSSAITNNESVSASVETVISAFTDSTLDDRYATKSHKHDTSDINELNEAIADAIESNNTVISAITEILSSDSGITEVINNVVSGQIDSAVSGKVNTNDYTTFTSSTNTALGNKFGGVDYVKNENKIYFYNNASNTGTALASIDTDDFIVDGMIKTVDLEPKSGSTYLVITWNTDAGSTVTELNIGDIFEADNYYQKTETSGKTEISTALSGKSDTGHTHDGIYAKNAFSRITVGSINVDADTTGDTLTISAGTNVTLTPDANGDKITIAATDTATTLNGHFVPTATTANTKSANASSTSELSWGSAVVTGVTLSGDAKGHITAVAVSSGKLKTPITGVTLASGTDNGTVKLTVNDSATDNIAVKGLNTAAYKAEGYFAGSGHTHTTSIATSTGTNQITLAASTKYAITAGGTSYIFTTPPDTNTWRPVGTGATDAAAGNHTHDYSSTYQAKGNYLSSTTTYAGSNSVGGAATSAAKLTNTAAVGSVTQPVFFTANGVPSACTYTLGKSVPSGAVFTDTTYTFDGTYNASTNKAATVSTVTNAINALDGNLNGTSPSAGKTLTAFSQTDGKVSATFGDISITKSQVSDFPTSMTPTAHNQASNTITAMTSYAKASSVSAIVSGDSLNTAIGKLEKALDGKQASGSYVTNDTFTAHTSSTAVHMSNTEKTNLDSLATNISAISGITSTKVSKWDNITDFLSGHNTVNTLANIPTTKRLVIATITSSTNELSLSGNTLQDGYEIHIIVTNNGSADAAVTLPSSGGYIAVGDLITIAASSTGEINVISDGTNLYVRGA